MGQAVVIGCSSVEFSTEKCTTIGDGGERAKEQISAAAGPGELREKTYVTARADADTALPISVRSQAPTARLSPRFDEAREDLPISVVRGAAARAAAARGAAAQLAEGERGGA